MLQIACHTPKNEFQRKILNIKIFQLLDQKIFQFLSLASLGCRNEGKNVQHLPLIISVRDEDEKLGD